MSTQLFSTTDYPSPLAKLGQQIALTGLGIYVIFAPHSVAASAIGVALAGIGWLLRMLTRRRGDAEIRRRGDGVTGRTPTHRVSESPHLPVSPSPRLPVSASPRLRVSASLIILLSVVWSVASAIFSEEPRISVAKLTALWTVFLFYLTRAVLNRRSILVLVALLILSGCAGALASVFDLVRGRGVVVETIGFNSPFHRVGIQPGDTIWRVNGRRVYSVSDLDEALKSIPANTPVAVGIISRGEQVERSGLVVSQPTASGIVGSERNHRFRASGWTRHYQTFAEIMQIIALLALGLALAHLRNHGPNKIFGLAIVAAALLMAALVLTAMRTVIVAFVIGASVIAWRSLRGVYKIVFTFALFFVIAFGAMVVWQTRDQNSLVLGDPSSSLRMQIARVGLSRILIHPIFGHGMDAMKLHWNEWGFPGNDILHLHSTPLQLAFDRGLPMLLLWLWMMLLFWLITARAERRAADLSDTNSYGIMLGTLGALTGFLASSLVNYNYGDSEVAMMFWFLMGIGSNVESALGGGQYRER